MKALRIVDSLRIAFILSVSVVFMSGCSDNPAGPTPDNLLPGIAYMGHGYDIFQEYARADAVMGQLLEYDDYQAVEVKGESYDVPSDITFMSLNTSDFKSVYGVNAYEYREALAINAHVEGGTWAFQAGLTENYSEEQYRSKYRAFCTVQNLIKKWKLTLPYTDMAKLRSMLTDEARSDLANLPAETLFDKYGTHFLAELIIGARADYNSSLTRSVETSSIKNNFQLCAEASFKKGTGSGDFSMVTENELLTFQSNSIVVTKVSGGRSEYGSYIFQSGNYEKWIESIDNIEDLTLADFTDNSLIPIWELCENETRRSELSSAFEDYAEQFALLPMADIAIEGLDTRLTWDPPITPELGWGFVDVDLNRGSGHAYIYLCYKNGLDYRQPITDITFIVNQQAVPNGYTKLPQDLNATVGGAFIYLCYKTGLTGEPIRRVDVLVGHDTVPSLGFHFGNNFYSQAKQDLNQGAGGNYLWLVYSHECPDPWQ
jgi:hypothetical protein